MTAGDVVTPMITNDLLSSIPQAEQIMGMPAVEQSPRRVWTQEEFEVARDAAPPGERWELIDGNVYVTPSPNRRHQQLALRLSVLLDAYVSRHRLGQVYFAPLDVRFRKGRVIQPDVLVEPPVELQGTPYPVNLLLAAEIISPSSSRTDRTIKRPVYQEAGVSEYWIIDDDARIIERWQPVDERPAIISDVLSWNPPGAAEPFLLDLTALFADP